MLVVAIATTAQSPYAQAGLAQVVPRMVVILIMHWL